MRGSFNDFWKRKIPEEKVFASNRELAPNGILNEISPSHIGDCVELFNQCDSLLIFYRMSGALFITEWVAEAKNTVFR